MKNQPVNQKSVTIEDIVFEGRNKSYGAYDLNHKCRKYMVIGFLATLLGVSSAVAVPFIKAFKDTGRTKDFETGVTVVVKPIKIDQPKVILPPEPTINEIKQAAYVIPVIVEEADEDEIMASNSELFETVRNIPVDIQHIEPIIEDQPSGIEEITEAPLFAEEDASFMGGDVTEFRNWVIKNITYPTVAVENHIFGKVIVEFTIDVTGNVTNIKFIRSLDPSVDNETRRVISSSPLWSPAKQSGRPTRQRFILPITFKME